MRVHELAKELGTDSKNIIALLTEKGIEVKNHMSSVDDNAAEFVRNKVKGEAPEKKQQASAKEEKPAQQAPKAEKAEAEASKPAEAEKPKKKISAVFNPQNSGNKKMQGNRFDQRRVIGGNDRNAQRNDRFNGNGDRRVAQNQERKAENAQAPEQKVKRIPRFMMEEQAGIVREEEPVVNKAPEAAAPKPEEVKVQPQAEEKPAEPVRPNVYRDSIHLQMDKPRENVYANMKNRPDQKGSGARPQNGQRNGDNRNNQGRPFDRNGRPGDRAGQGRPFDKNGRPGDRAGQGRPGDNRNNQGRPDARPGQGRPGDRAGQGRPAPAAEPVSNKSDNRHAAKGQFKKNNKDREFESSKENSKLTKNDIKKDKPQEKKEEEIKVITLPDTLTIKDLADKLKLQPSALVKKLFLQGKVVTINQDIDFETAEEIALEYDVISEREVKVDVIAELLKEEEEAEDTMITRPPVVCVMGHVDHGKTSLLDAIRETNVTSREAGGITQHIGAYMVEKNGKKITFLDTPGHEAFTAMRMRGANSTDIAILVVAADDGVMPQTVEAINHAKAAGIHIIVAVNKIDKPAANVEKVKQELTEYELIAEDWGGDTIFVPVSAHTKEGIDTLLEMVLLDAEMCELKANPNRRARGLVIEAKLDKGKGPVATVLVQKGTLRVGDNIAAGEAYGKVRAMMDDQGRSIKEAGPSTPVEILGLSGVPNAGETFKSFDSDKEAKNFASVFVSENKKLLIDGTKAKMSLDDLFSQIQAGEVKELEVVVKADVQGSVEAMKQSLTKLSNSEVAVKIIHSGVGAITESDVILASASNAIVVGFNVKPDNQAREIAEHEKVDVRLYSVIYNAIEDIEAAMKGMLDPIYEEKIIGHAEIRQIFKASGVGNIAGSYVLDGMFKRDCKVRISRDGEQIFEGPLASLKRFKDDVKEVKAGFECGLVFDGFGQISEGDQVEAYEMVEVPR